MNVAAWRPNLRFPALELVCKSEVFVKINPLQKHCTYIIEWRSSEGEEGEKGDGSGDDAGAGERDDDEISRIMSPKPHLGKKVISDGKKSPETSLKRSLARRWRQFIPP